MQSSVAIADSTVMGLKVLRGGQFAFHKGHTGYRTRGRLAGIPMRQHRKRSIYMARENIKTLLERKRMTIKEVSNMLGHDKSWLSKILKSDEAQDKDPNSRSITMETLDELAQFFGLEPYQLLMPGMSALLERRKGAERRTWNQRAHERRTAERRSEDRRAGERRERSRDIVAKVERRAREVNQLLRVKGE